MSFGWGHVPMQAPALAEAPTVEGEQIEVIQLVTNRASAPSLGDFLAELHNSDVLSDITICSEDGQAIKCHKLVLIRWSAPFRRMLCGDMREAREKRITLHGVDGEVLAAFLRFLYTCTCSISPDKLVGLCAMADQYDVTLLQQLCMDAIRTHAHNHRCCCLFYKAAKDTQQPEIQQLAWEQLASNLNGLVRQHDVFVTLEFEDLLRLFNRPTHTQAQMMGPSTSAAAASSSRPSAGVTAAAAVAAVSSAGGLWSAASAPVNWGAGRDAADVSGVAAGGAGAPGTTRAASFFGAPLVVLGDDAAPGGTGQPQQQPEQPTAQQPWLQQQQQPPLVSQTMSRNDIAVAYQQAGRSTLGPSQPQPRRPEYALFLATMAWLHHLPERQQYKQQLYECFDFTAMTADELSQMRRNPYVQSDAELKEMLLDAFESRILAASQQPVYHMGPLPRSTWDSWGSSRH